MRLDRWQDKGRYGSLWIFPRAITSSVRRPADREEDHNIKSECRSRTVVRPADFKQIETCNVGQTALYLSMRTTGASIRCSLLFTIPQFARISPVHQGSRDCASGERK